jgi:hypothetical protein
MFRSVVYFTFLVAVVVNGSETTTTQSEDAVAVALPENDRDLQIQVGDAICPSIESLFGGTVECACDVPLDYPLNDSFADVSCARKVCGPGKRLCSDVVFGSKVSLGPVVIGAKLCIDNIKLFNVGFPNLKYCLNYSTARRKRNRSIPTGCTASVNKKECKSCKPCDREGGVKFDCTNVVPDFMSTKCTPFRPYLGPGSNPSSKIPSLV